MTIRINIDWRKFNRWTVISDWESIVSKKSNWKPRYIRTLLCECECWTIKEVRHWNIVNWISSSCWCHHKEICKALMEKLRPTQFWEKNPNWRWWVQTENSKKVNKERNTRDSRTWRKNILLRDWVCNICWTNENLQAHHLKNWKANILLRVDEWNWVCLCKYCHHLFHKQYWFKNNSIEQFNDFKLCEEQRLLNHMPNVQKTTNSKDLD